ncbi:MAG: hypothetical protein ACJASL_002892 [Paraglaciecola sp.]|jgi:hypothetical protein
MNNNLIFLPVLAHIFLIFTLYIYLGMVKSKAVKDGSVDRQKASLNSKAWPDNVVQVSNNLDNQFESPIIFYMLSVIYYLIGDAGSVLLSIMSLYVITRYAHAYVHVTSNYVPYRFQIFRAGVLLLLGLSIWLVLKLIGL